MDSTWKTFALSILTPLLAGGASGYLTTLVGETKTCTPGEQRKCEPHQDEAHVQECAASGREFTACHAISECKEATEAVNRGTNTLAFNTLWTGSIFAEAGAVDVRLVKLEPTSHFGGNFRAEDYHYNVELQQAGAERKVARAVQAGQVARWCGGSAGTLNVRIYRYDRGPAPEDGVLATFELSYPKSARTIDAYRRD